MIKTSSSVGIDAMAFSGPAAYLALEDLAIARGVDPDKFLVGLGQQSMSIASPCEDAVTMAVAAGFRALQKFNVDPAEIGSLIVGTETGIDHSKPVAAYVHELLGLAKNCRTFETKHACFGATAGLTSSMDWIASGRASGRKALVIATDIASYGLNTAGEPTQGAGAVAMVISEQPRLLAIDMTQIGEYTKQVMDFWRPLYSKHAIVDGHYSVSCYLEALTEARTSALALADPQPALGAWLYHVPFVKMAQKAHQHELELSLGRSLELDCPSDRSLLAQSYGQLTAPYLKLNAIVGNIYTGSLFLSLLDLLRQNPESLRSKEISLFSYGSGCGATWLKGSLQQTLDSHHHLLDPQPELNARKKLDVQTYEAWIRENEQAHETKFLNPSNYGLNSCLAYLGTANHKRRYEWIA